MKEKIIILLIFSMLGGLFLLLGIIFTLQGKMFEQKGIETQARIVRIETERQVRTTRNKKNRRNKVKKVVYVSYNVNGVQYEEELGAYASGMNEGDEITIRYMKDDPSNIAYGNSKMIVGVSMDVVGVLLIVGGIIAFVCIKPKRNMEM